MLFCWKKRGGGENLKKMKRCRGVVVFFYKYILFLTQKKGKEKEGQQADIYPKKVSLARQSCTDTPSSTHTKRGKGDIEQYGNKTYYKIVEYK